MHGENISYAYCLWSLVIVNVALFVYFISAARVARRNLKKILENISAKRGSRCFLA